MKCSATSLATAVTLAAAAALGVTASPARDASPEPGAAERTRASGSAARSTDEAMADDATFVRDALEGGRREVAQAREVVTRTSREDLRSTAQMLMTEHIKMNAQLETLAAKKGWKIAELSPMPPPSSPSSRADDVDADAGDSGARDAELDSSFIRTQIEEHERNIELFRRRSTTASDADVRELAARAVPRLEQHLAALRKLGT
jgi:putative membrane protein